ncbi:MAG TPA: response regulator [Thermomicrobiales bacterium]|jgi:CheY-like chemotaxis protein
MVARIVFCEDDPGIGKLVRVALRPTGHEVHVAVDGEAGLALIEDIRPDLVFTDVAMPRLDGLQLADALKGRPHLAHIPVVLITASVQRAQVEEGYRHGVTAHLAKPFSAQDLVAMVGRMLSPA